MTIEQKALELDLIARVIAAYHTTRMIEDAHKHCHASPHVREAIDRLIASVAEADKSRHAAEMREQAERFSEAVQNYYGDYPKDRMHPALSRFILAPVDPLVVEAREICARVCEGWTDIPNDRAAAYRDGMHDDEADFAYALDALRKAAIVKKEAVNG